MERKGFIWVREFQQITFGPPIHSIGPQVYCLYRVPHWTGTSFAVGLYWVSGEGAWWPFWTGGTYIWGLFCWLLLTHVFWCVDKELDHLVINDGFDAQHLIQYMMFFVVGGVERRIITPTLHTSERMVAGKSTNIFMLHQVATIFFCIGVSVATSITKIMQNQVRHSNGKSGGIYWQERKKQGPKAFKSIGVQK